MKYLGIDFGSKRVGLATSDGVNSLAFPYAVILNDHKLVAEILKIIKKENIDQIVIGESNDFDGVPNKIMKEIKEFTEIMAKETKLSINFEPEFFTSVQAEHLQGKNKMNDASAATIILQSYLDRLK